MVLSFTCLSHKGLKYLFDEKWIEHETKTDK